MLVHHHGMMHLITCASSSASTDCSLDHSAMATKRPTGGQGVVVDGKENVIHDNLAQGFLNYGTSLAIT